MLDACSERSDTRPRPDENEWDGGRGGKSERARGDVDGDGGAWIIKITSKRSELLKRVDEVGIRADIPRDREFSQAEQSPSRLSLSDVLNETRAMQSCMEPGWA